MEGNGAALWGFLSGLLGGVAALLSAIGAMRSARSAKNANEALAGQQLSLARRDVAQLVSACTIRHRHIENLTPIIESLLTSTSTFNGGLGSRWKNGVESVRAEAAKAESAFAPVAPYKDSPAKISILIVEDTERYQVDFAIALADLESVSIELTRLYERLLQEEAQHRAEVIASTARARDKLYQAMPEPYQPGRGAP